MQNNEAKNNRILAVFCVLLTVIMIGLIFVDQTSVMPLSNIDILPSSDLEPPYQVDINSASQIVLQEIPGVGPVISGEIIAYREQNGAFNSVDELLEVKGIGEKTLEKIKPYISIS